MNEALDAFEDHAVFFIIGLIALALVYSDTRAQDAPAVHAPSKLSDRVPWTTSHITGSADGPSPFQTRRAFPKLTFTNPLDMAYWPGGKRIFVLEQTGKLYSFANDSQCAKADLILDLAQAPGFKSLSGATKIDTSFSFTLHPRFDVNHFVYICYCGAYPDKIRNHENGFFISRFTVNETNPLTVDPKSELVILRSTAGGHNGCCLKFGPDGFLYISTGDGGDPDPPDPSNTGQDISDLLSSVLRIDVDHPRGNVPYSIPANNPFIKTPGARPEVFAYGLRNPFRMSFDRQTGLLWVGDVGWELWESVDCVKAGGNYGWSIMEGPNPVHANGKRGPTPITPPVIALSHTEAASLTGGIVYHGTKFPELAGSYIFGDWQTERLWAAKCNGDTLEPHHEIAMTDQRIVAFAEQPDGELMIVDYQGGGLWTIERNDAPKESRPFPHQLSGTGLFESTSRQTPQPGVIPYSINAPQWVDGATAQRFVAIPGASTVFWGKGVWGDDRTAWPKDSVFLRTFSLETRPGEPASSKKIETQILHFDGRQWQGYSYAWNDQQTDAELVGARGAQRQIAITDASFPGGVRSQNWAYLSRAQCMTCHNAWCNYTLGFDPTQLDQPRQRGDIVESQIRTLKKAGLLLDPLVSHDPLEVVGNEQLVLTNPYDATANLNERARSYLHVNCSHCHRFGGGGSALFDVRKELPLDKMNLVGVRANLGNFGMGDASLICPGDADRSVLVYRTSKLGRGRMPHIGSECVDVRGVSLLREWAMSLQKAAPDSSPTTARADRLASLKVLKDSAILPAQATGAIDRLLSSTSGAMALVNAVEAGQLPAQWASLAKVRGAASTQETVRDLFRRFDPEDTHANRLGSNIDPSDILALHGDPLKGRAIFFQLTGTGLCARCHKVADKGTDFGPELSHIATKYGRADVLDNILNPSKTIAPGYATYIVKTTAGEVESGFLVVKTDHELVIKTAEQKLIHIPANQVQKLAEQKISAMPEGLLSDLEAQQAADLLDYVMTLK